jgi:hypothetical protein
MSASEYKENVKKARAIQARKVMPMIGPLLDAWDQLPNDVRGDSDLEQLAKHLEQINEGMRVDLQRDDAGEAK